MNCSSCKQFVEDAENNLHSVGLLWLCQECYEAIRDAFLCQILEDLSGKEVLMIGGESE